MHVHSALLCRRSKRGKIHVHGDVLLSGSFVGVGAYGVLSKCRECSAMTSGALLLASVSVVDGDENAAVHAGGDPRHRLLCDQRNLNSFIAFGMDAVTVEEIHFLG